MSVKQINEDREGIVSLGSGAVDGRGPSREQQNRATWTGNEEGKMNNQGEERGGGGERTGQGREEKKRCHNIGVSKRAMKRDRLAKRREVMKKLCLSDGKDNSAGGNELSKE